MAIEGAIRNCSVKAATRSSVWVREAMDKDSGPPANGRVALQLRCRDALLVRGVRLEPNFDLSHTLRDVIRGFYCKCRQVRVLGLHEQSNNSSTHKLNVVQCMPSIGQPSASLPGKAVQG